MDDDSAQRTYSESQLMAAVDASAGRSIERLMEALATDDDDLRGVRIRLVVGHLCIRLFHAGYETGISEAAAQLVEAGITVVLDKPDQLFVDDGPLNDDWDWD